MQRRILSAILLLSLFLSPAGAAFAAPDAPQAVLDACASVVRVEVDATDGYVYTGSGFIVQNGADGTLIVTNAHVVEDAATVSVWRDREALQSAEVAALDTQVDLAVLHVAEPLEGPALPLSLEVERGMAVYAIGYPGAADGLSVQEAHAREDATITDGLISAIRQAQAVSYGPEIPLLQTNAALNPGNSGGPLLNEAGAVVGVNTYGVTDAQGVFGAIATEQLLETLSLFGYAIEPVPGARAGAGALVFLLPAAVLLAAGACLAVLLTRRRRRAARADAAQAQAAPLPADEAEPQAAPLLVDEAEAQAAPLLVDEAQTQAAPIAPDAPETPITPAAPAGGKRRRWRWAVAGTAAGLLLLAGLALGHVLVNHQRARTAMREMDFSAAQAAMERTLVGETLFRQDCSYIDAGLLLDARRYDEAIAAFEALGTFEGAEGCIREANYRKAARLADQQRYDEAVALYESLADYRDSVNRALNTRLRKANYFAEQQDYRTAIDLYDALLDTSRANEAEKLRAQAFYNWAYDLLRGGQYLSAYEKAQEAEGEFDMQEFYFQLQPLLYEEMVDRYQTRAWNDVLTRCEILDGYQYSDWYFALATIHQSGAASPLAVERYLLPYVGYEDVNELLMLNYDIAISFLAGSWLCYSGEGLQFDLEGNFGWALPANDFGDYWDIDHGTLYFADSVTGDKCPVFEITILSNQSIRVYSHLARKSYTLYRVS